MLERFRQGGSSRQRRGGGSSGGGSEMGSKSGNGVSETVRVFESGSRKLTPRGSTGGGGAGGLATPRSTVSSVGTTASRLCHYLEDSLNVINNVTEHIESAGAQFAPAELDGMFKQVLSELQRVIIRSGSLDAVQVDVLAGDLRGLLATCDRNLDSRSKEQLAGLLSRIAKQAERMEGSRQQNGSKRAPGLPPTGASEQAGSGERQRAAVIASDEDTTANGGALVPAAGTMDLREEIERLKQNNQALAMQFKQKEARLAEHLRNIMTGQNLMQLRSGQGQAWGVGETQAQAWGSDSAGGGGYQQSQPGGPITIHNHVGVEQQANAEAAQRQSSKQTADFKAKLVARLKTVSSGPWGLLLAGVAGLVVREVAGRVMGGSRRAALRGADPKALRRLQQERRTITREALRQLHTCERAFHEVKQQGMKTIRNPFDQPRVQCAPDYLVFEEPESGTA